MAKPKKRSAAAGKPGQKDKAAAAKKGGGGGPDTAQKLEMPSVRMFRQIERVAQVLSVMNEHDYGTFKRSALFVDENLTDDRIAGVAEQRVAAIKAAPFKFLPAGDTPAEIQAAEELGGTDRQSGHWREIVSSNTLGELLMWGWFLGFGYAKIDWLRDEDYWMPRLTLWHPQWVRWDWNKRRFVAQTSGGEEVLPNPDLEPRGDGRWFLWCPFGVQNGWLRAVLRSMGQKYLARTWNERDWDRYIERQALAVMKLKVPTNAEETDKAAIFSQLNNIGSEAAVMLPQSGSKEVPGYDLEALEFGARTWEAMKDRKSALDVDIAVRILGQNLTTEVTSGSRAAAETHRLVGLWKAMADAEIGNAFRAQVLTWWAEYNYGDPELAPWPTYQISPGEDELQEAQALKAIGDAASALKTAEPRTDVIAILEEHGVPLISEEELAARAEAETPPEDDPDAEPGDDEEDEEEGEEDEEEEDSDEEAVAATSYEMALAGRLIPVRRTITGSEGRTYEQTIWVKAPGAKKGKKGSKPGGGEPPSGAEAAPPPPPAPAPAPKAAPVPAPAATPAPARAPAAAQAGGPSLDAREAPAFKTAATPDKFMAANQAAFAQLTDGVNELTAGGLVSGPNGQGKVGRVDKFVVLEAGGGAGIYNPKTAELGISAGIAKDLAAAMKSGSVDTPEQLTAVNTLFHEILHVASNQNHRYEWGTGTMQMEEATTEILAQHLGNEFAEKRLGLKVSASLKTEPLFRVDQGEVLVRASKEGAYEEEMESFARLVSYADNLDAASMSRESLTGHIVKRAMEAKQRSDTTKADNWIKDEETDELSPPPLNRRMTREEQEKNFGFHARIDMFAQPVLERNGITKDHPHYHEIRHEVNVASRQVMRGNYERPEWTSAVEASIKKERTTPSAGEGGGLPAVQRVRGGIKIRRVRS